MAIKKVNAGHWENNSKRLTEYSQLKKWGD